MFFTVRPLPHVKKRRFPRTIFAYTDLSASAYYRLQVPATALAEAGYPVAWGPIEMFAGLPRSSYDMVVTSRTGTGDPVVVRNALESEMNLGHVLLLDYDDDVLNIPEHNAAKHDSTEGILMAMGVCDGLVVTNGSLKRSFKAHTKQIGIVPNYIDRRQWDIPKRADDTNQVKIGIFGTKTHNVDWELVRDPLHQIVRDYPNVKIVCGGYQPEYLADISYLLPWAPLCDYPKMLQNIDIGLCPLIDDPFNRCKSPIKAYEYGMAGCTVVASPTQYDSVVRGRGSIAKTERDWYNAIRYYVENKAARRAAAAALRQYVLRSIDVRTHAEEIAQTYYGLYKTAVAQRVSVNGNRT